MKKLLLIALTVIFAVGLFGQLGLRTLTPEPTETADASETGEIVPDSEELNTLSLRTIDPLLVSFREGWTSPDDPSWKVEMIGSTEIMIPQDFSIFQEKTGLNYDVQIFDKEGLLFGRLFLYQLESYARSELISAVVGSLYGEGATTESSYEETVELHDGRIAYLVSLKIRPEVDYPFVVVYSPSEEADTTEPGAVTMCVFEPLHYSGSELDKAKEIIAGIVGSLISAEEEPEEEEEVIALPSEKEEHTDIFVRMVESLLSEEDLDIYIDDWIEVEGDYFAFMMPPEFSVAFYLADYFEVADLGFQGTVVGKIFVGESEESASTSDVLNQYVYQYLGSFGDYELVDSYTGYVDRESVVNVYALDFSGQLCWMALYSESHDAEFSGPGEYFVLLGLADYEEAVMWAEWYTGILATLDF
ncbi:MAG: hypothetical protein H7A29_08085 [Thermotogae bacterium]|nr:hypothetical protein [Thermotogota bacterium]